MNLKIILVNICFLLPVPFLYNCGSNLNSPNIQKEDIQYSRHPSQIYLEDSADVFWTYYPDPFSNPYYTDRFVITQAISFECFIKGNIEVGFVDSENGDIIYKFKHPVKQNKYFWIWVAKSTADTTAFPNEYFQSTTINPLNIVLIVDGRSKTILPLKIKVPINIYCFINWKNYF